MLVYLLCSSALFSPLVFNTKELAERMANLLIKDNVLDPYDYSIYECNVFGLDGECYE